MKISLLPKSRLGKWTVGLEAFYLLVIIFSFTFIISFKFITSEKIMHIFGATAAIATITAFITAIIAVIKNKERSILVFLAILIGLIVLAFNFGDILGLPDVNLPGV